ncbi:LysR family transcriptional regulator [Mucilaginibacter segetis]|uniref:LysR family transcriptional regulator n=1 Tax=Mucilaginibacter segetis TaxID=2793071 RepID=A0A934UNW1_9SPHI|nr:LysR family transcriptional regulator [Mucilaginibacter segetis]MBK0380814.1 LysR family transcriptional regulator [Mucilaginibacter segetis]
MFDFRLQVFYTVAKRLNFTRAAAELFITQPAVTKHIHELEREFKVSLFERSGNKKIVLTVAGEVLLQYTEKLASIYRELEYDMNLLVEKYAGILRIGASTTIAQYVIPPVLAQFHQKFKDVQINLIAGNTEQIEQALINKEIDLGIVEGFSRNPQIQYNSFLDDELVLVSSVNNSLMKKDTIKPEELKNYPLLLREPGSGTLDVIAHALKDHGIKLTDLNIEMQLGSTESIKSYLLSSNCMAFLSVQSILKELKTNECRIIDIKNMNILRPFYFIQLHGQAIQLASFFLHFAKSFKM